MFNRMQRQAKLLNDPTKKEHKPREVNDSFREENKRTEGAGSVTVLLGPDS